MERKNRFAALTFGVICYALFFGTLLYLIAFMADVGVAKTIETGSVADLGRAFVIDALLLALFGVQHSVMARPRFKAWLTRFVPRELERSIYVLASSLVLIVLIAAWQPIGAVVWHVENATARAAIRGLFFAGFGTLLYSTFLIDHFDLFGLRQVVLHFRGKAYTEKHFATPSLYRFVRHPLYIGWILMFWAAPTMSVGHLVFSLGMTLYILLAIPYEERDLAAALGEPYTSWRARTPAFMPAPARGRAETRRQASPPVAGR